MANTRKNRRGCGRKNTRKNNMMGGRRRTRSRFSPASKVAGTAGVLVQGASNTVVTAGKSALGVLNGLVRGVVKTGKTAARAVNKTIHTAVSRRNRRNRRH